MKSASASLPVPDSPVIKTFASVEATRSARRTASLIAGERANISITVGFSKNYHQLDCLLGFRLGSLRAKVARGRKTCELCLQKHERQNHRNREESIPQFVALLPA